MDGGTFNKLRGFAALGVLTKDVEMTAEQAAYKIESF